MRTALERFSAGVDAFREYLINLCVLWLCIAFPIVLYGSFQGLVMIFDRLFG
jgi:hypothetical protein